MTAPEEFWSSLAATASFSHPVDHERLDRLLPRGARLLDVGCGFGRALAELRDHGRTALVGVDFAEGMLARGRREHPDLDLRLADGRRLPFDDGVFDGAMLFAVLTTIASDADQDALVAEVRRVLAPGGLVYVSDLFLNDDERNVARYEDGRRRGLGPWGTFEVEPGGRCRHHDPARIEALFAAFDRVELVHFTAVTMHCHTSRAFQLFARRPV